MNCASLCTGGHYRRPAGLDALKRCAPQCRHVKQLLVVLAVCLSLQASAAFAPFVHLHADAAHETDHHDGRVVHSHAAAHASAVAHPHESDADGPTADAPALADGAPVGSVSPVEVVSARASVWAIGATAKAGAWPAVVEVVTERVAVPALASSPPDDVGVDPPKPIDRTPSSLRGPPR